MHRMHELSLAQELIEQIARAAERENAVRVLRVVVVIGAYSGVECDAFSLAFPLAAEGTVTEGAELVIEALPARAVCRQCQNEVRPAQGHLICEHCGSTAVSVHAGRELLIRSIDLEIPGDQTS